MDDSAGAESAGADDSKVSEELSQTNASMLSNDHGGGNDADDYDDGDEGSNGDGNISPLTGVPPAGPGDDAPGLLFGAPGDKVASPLLVGGLFGVGQRVEGRFGGQGKYYPGAVAAVNGDGTYHLRYDDGDQERRAPEAGIRALDAPSGDEGGDDGPLVGPGLLDAAREASSVLSEGGGETQGTGDEASGYEDEVRARGVVVPK
jgi:hypothetical protein